MRWRSSGSSIFWSNASTAIVQTVVEMTEEEDRLVSVNLKGTFLLAKYGIPRCWRPAMEPSR